MVALEARHYRLVLVAASLIVVVGLLVAARGALFPFFLGGVLAYLLYPVVRALESLMPWRKRFPDAARVVAILAIYVLTLGVVAGVLAIVVPPAFREAGQFVETIPELYTNARTTVEGWSEQYTSRVPEEVRTQIEAAAADVGSVLIDASRSVLVRTVSGVSNALTIVIGLATLPFFLFYLLKDREAAVEGFYSLLPLSARRHARNVMAIVNGVLGSYIRVQLLLGLVVGVMVYIGLLVLGISFPVLLAVVAGLFELVPIIGPILGAIPGVLVTLSTSPSDLVWVILLYLGVQGLENGLLVPRLQGRAVDIHPAIIMVILVVASEAAGLFGMVVAVPLAAVARDVFRYFYQEWSVGGQLEEVAETEVEVEHAVEQQEAAVQPDTP